MKTLVILSVLLALSCGQGIENLSSLFKEFQHRIAGGSEARPHEFPYQIGLYMQIIPEYEGQEERLHAWCGASLISKNHVLTAAHCLLPAEAGVVVIGAHDFTTQGQGRSLIKIFPSDWIIHPEYDPEYSKNDIAIITLPKSIELNDKIQTINLPSPDILQSDIEGRMATVSGWGRLGDSDPTSNVLQYANLRILSNAVCKMYYSILFRNTNVCVDGSDGKSVCPGDSGGPLVITDANGKKTLIGLTSFGRKEGCQVGFPTVFTRVSSYVAWIHSITRKSIEN